MTAEQALDLVELAILRIRDREATRQPYPADNVRMLNDLATEVGKLAREPHYSSPQLAIPTDGFSETPTRR